MEFIKCVERITRLIMDISESQNTANASAILMGLDLGKEGQTKSTNEDMNEDQVNNLLVDTPIQLSQRQLYLRISENIDTICLYEKINRKILDEDPDTAQSEQFI